MLIVVFTRDRGGGGDDSGSGSGKDANYDGMMIYRTVEEINQTNWPYAVNFQSYHPR